MLFAEWYRICELPGANDAACAHYIMQLHQNGLLKGDEMTERFFRLLTVSSITLEMLHLVQTRNHKNNFFVSPVTLGTFCCTLLIF